MSGHADSNSGVGKTRLIGGVGLVGGFLLLNSLCTEFIAWKLNFQAALGSTFAGFFYQPFAWFEWLFSFYRYSPNIYNYTFVGFMLGTLGILVGYVLFVGFRTRSSRQYSDVHGTAHFATAKEVKEGGLLPAAGEKGKGVYCGGWVDPENPSALHYLRHDGPEHICALAPTRSGKGIGLVVPTLLSWPHSVFTLDRKGENFAMTAGWRKQAGNLILKFDPAEPHGSCSWNPLAEIRFGTRYQISDTQNIALMIVDTDGKGFEDNHFRNAAYELLVGLILHTLYKQFDVGRVPGIRDCAHVLTGVGDFATPGTESDPQDNPASNPKSLYALFDEMISVKLTLREKIEDPEAKALAEKAVQEAQLVINGVGQRMRKTGEKELGSILSTANNALQLYRDPIVGDNTSRCDFLVSDLMDHDKPVSLYFITTPANADRMRPLARLLLARIVLSLADRMEFDEGGRSKTAHKHRLLLMLDEFPTLGKIEVFESALAYIAGYGMKAYIIAQDVQQLYKAYTKSESIISNCHIRVAYAPNNLDTAEWMSKMVGTTTVVKEQISTSGKRFGAVMEQVSRSYSEVSRPLLTADEIMRLPGPVKDAKGDIVSGGEMLVFVAGQPVIRGSQILYFKDPVFLERAKIKPPETEYVREDVPLAKPAGTVDARKGYQVPL